MKMPTSTETKVKKVSKAPSSIHESECSELEAENAGRQCVTFLEKKMRNLEKRKKKMDLNRQKASSGEKLEKEALLSLEQYDSVYQDLQFAAELLKQLVSINEEYEESMKNKAKKDIKKIEEVLKLQYTLDQLGGDSVRQDFKAGNHGAVILTEDNLKHLDALYKVISPTRDALEKEEMFEKKLYTASNHLANFVDGEDSQVVGSTTYKQLKELVTLITGCGYFERVHHVETEKPRDQEKVVEVITQEEINTPEQSEPIVEKTLEEPLESPENIAQTVEETSSQPLNTLEQDAFFAPSSTHYQTSSESTSFSSQPASCDISKPCQPDIQSFTHNRPFQFIQASFVMPESDSPSVDDPAVIAAQPAGAHGLQFMAPLYESNMVSSSSVLPQQQKQQQHPQQSSQSHQQPSQQPQTPHHVPQHQTTPATSSLLSSQSPQSQTANPSSNINSLGMPVDLTQSPVDLSQSGINKHPSTTSPQTQDFHVQSNYQQAESSLFPTQPVSRAEMNSSSLSGHSESRSASMREDTISSLSYDIPPSIPMPPSQDGTEPQEKKSPMNANAPVFQSMYQGGPQGPNMATPSGTSSDIQNTSNQSEFASFGGPSGDFVGSGDFQSGYQGSNGFSNGSYGRGPGGGNRGGYRGQRGGGNSGPNMNNRNGGSPIQQNGYGQRSSPTNNNYSRGARGGSSYQNYGGSNAGYRSENFQQSNYGSGSFGNANNYPKRGGMNNNMGPGNSGYPPRPAGMGGNSNRGGAMRGGGGMVPRGGPRGGGPHRGGFSRQQ